MGSALERRIAAVAVPFGLVVGLVLAACGESSFGPPAAASDAGTDAAEDSSSDAADADGGDAAPICPLPGSFGSAACNRCMGERCCAVVTACESDPVCKALEHCVLACIGTPDRRLCYEACLQSNANGRALWEPVLGCWSGPSDTLCYGDCTRSGN
jgi:hypothetical protein